MCLDKLKKLSRHFYLIFRLIVGLLFFMHGATKFGIIGNGNISGFAGMLGGVVWLASLVAAIELLGGLGIAFGLLTRLSAIGGSVIMVVALIMVHFPKGWNPLVNGGELPLLFLMSFLVIMTHGAGNLSLGKALFKKEVC